MNKTVETNELQANIQKSAELLKWYEGFKREQLPTLSQYTKTCDANDKVVIDSIIAATTMLDPDLQHICVKEKWEHMSLTEWNHIYSEIRRRIESIKTAYHTINSKVCANQESLDLEM